MRFDSYHPTLNFIFFISVIAMTFAFNHPMFTLIAFVSAFIYSVKLSTIRALIFNLACIVFALIYTAYYSYYTHFGSTVLTLNIIGNNMTLESILYALSRGFRFATVLMWFSCMNVIVSSDKVIYLLGRLSPKLSLFLSITLRIVPRVKASAKKIHTAQQCLGRGVNQGSIFRRIRNLIKLISIVITWTMENLVESSESMRSRGYTLKGRTAYSIYRFDNRDRAVTIILFWMITLVSMGTFLDQTKMIFDPEIIINPITFMSVLFYVFYAVLCLLPLCLESIGEFKHKLAVREVA